MREDRGAPTNAAGIAPQASSSGRIVRDISLSLGAPGQDIAIVCGDNAAVIDAIEADLRGRVACIYIDPPYNNQESYAHYVDRAPHERWLAEITHHVRQLYPLLTSSGSLWISIDDREMHYLKTQVDAVFGRENFVATIVWEHRKTRENRNIFSHNHEYILVFAKDRAAFKTGRNLLPLGTESRNRFRNPDNDPRGPWQSVSANVQAGHGTKAQFYEIVAPEGHRHLPPTGRCWIYTEDRMAREIATGNIWFGRRGDGVPRLKKFLRDAKRGLAPHTLWRADEVGTSNQAKKHLLRLFPGESVFDTPKPEQLIERILAIATKEGDLVLDTFLGSGTTAAVAQRLGRRFLGVEINPLAAQACAKRLHLAYPRGAARSEVSQRSGFDFFRLA